MTSKMESLKIEIEQLPVQERSLLIQHLISTLDESEDVDSEELWFQEAERRYKLWQEGKIQSRPASEVFRDALAKFK